MCVDLVRVWQSVGFSWVRNQGTPINLRQRNRPLSLQVGHVHCGVLATGGIGSYETVRALLDTEQAAALCREITQWSRMVRALHSLGWLNVRYVRWQR